MLWKLTGEHMDGGMFKRMIAPCFKDVGKV
jgi:hypothetical protein